MGRAVSETSELTKALKDLTAELRLQRGVKPDASPGDEPEPLPLRDHDQSLRLIEPLVETNPSVYGRIMSNRNATEQGDQ